MQSDKKELQQKMLELVRAAIERDNELRKEHQIGDKFRFVSDRLQTLMERLENHMQVIVKEEKPAEVVFEDEVLVYVYLYNAHGISLPSWQNMLSPRVFYEYSVNRPIYAEKKYIESMLRAKGNKAHHAYLTVAIKKKDIVQADDTLKDTIGNPVIRVKEGSLRFERLVSFTHNELEYELNEDSELVRKK